MRGEWIGRALRTLCSIEGTSIGSSNIPFGELSPRHCGRAAHPLGSLGRADLFRLGNRGDCIARQAMARKWNARRGLWIVEPSTGDRRRGLSGRGWGWQGRNTTLRRIISRFGCSTLILLDLGLHWKRSLAANFIAKGRFTALRACHSRRLHRHNRHISLGKGLE